MSDARSPGKLYVSFGLQDKIGITVVDTVKMEGPAALLVVSGVSGVAQDAGVPVGAIVTRLHADALPPGVSQEKFFERVMGFIKAPTKGAALVIGFDVTFAADNAKLPLMDANTAKGFRKAPAS